MNRRSNTQRVFTFTALIMQLLGEKFIVDLCKHLENKGFWKFSHQESFKFFSVNDTWLFNHTYKSKWNRIDKTIPWTYLKDLIVDWTSRVMECNSNYDNIKWYFDRDKNHELKKGILEFYYSQNILFCPYCWLNQFQILGTESISSFDLDHFLPKSKISQFALSLYNLIPVCKYCNQSLKWAENPLQNWKNIFHPIRWWLKYTVSWSSYFLEQILPEKSFDQIFDCKKNRNGITWEVFETNDTAYKHHLEFFRLRELYLQSPHLRNDMNHIKKNSW